MTGWLLLSDRDAPVGAALPDRLATGSLVVELSWPVPTGVLLDWRGDTGQALSLFHHPASGIGLLWRDGATLRRFLLPGALRLAGRVMGEHLLRAMAGEDPAILQTLHQPVVEF